MKKEVMIVTGAGQIGMAIARRTGFGKKIILGDKSLKNAETIAEIMNNAGYDVVPFEMDLSSRTSILAIIAGSIWKETEGTEEHQGYDPGGTGGEAEYQPRASWQDRARQVWLLH